MELLSVWPPEGDTSDESCEPVLSSILKRPEGESEVKQVEKRSRHSSDEEESFANVAMARWWKLKGRYESQQSRSSTIQSSNPNTLLREISKLAVTQEFLRSEVNRLIKKTQSCLASARTHAALATFFEKTGELEMALEHIEKAITKDEVENEYKWLRHKFKKQITVKEEQMKRLKDLGIATNEMPKFLPVERRSATYLTFNEFFICYAMKKVPVIITDATSEMTSVPWSLDHIKEIAGSCRVVLKKPVPGSVEWAQLEDAETVTVSEFIDSLSEQQNTKDQRYLFDWGLPIHCPQLASELIIPKYFANDFLQRLPPASMYRDSWPSLFIAPKGIRSELHVDAFGSNFWMALFQGKKRWVFFPKDDLPLLYPSYGSDVSTEPTFDVDLQQPDIKQYPLLQLTTPMECNLEPGELLFVPAGCPHYVENLDQTIAISANYVDMSNLNLVKEELALNGLLCDRAASVLEEISSVHFSSNMNGNIVNLTWKEFKEWPKTYGFEPLNISQSGMAQVRHEASDVFCRGPLLDTIQQSGIYPDSKTFVDMHMLMDPGIVLDDFRELVRLHQLDQGHVQAFVRDHFGGPGEELEPWIPDDWTENPKLLEKLTDPSLREFAKYLNNLWKVLARKMLPLEHPERHSLIPVTHPFMIPGERFREFYYWDTYWVIGGLLAVGMTKSARGMICNLLQLVDRYGFVPNGGRIYYLNRSQPPLLIPMTDLYYENTGDSGLLNDNISVMEKELQFWIQNRTVTVKGLSGAQHELAIYCVQTSSPRPEGYMTDLKAVQELSGDAQASLLSHISSACESGWDFSTRWCEDNFSLKTIKTCHLVPVDLNVYLCWSEQLLSKYYGILGQKTKQETYLNRAQKRKIAIDDVFWDDNLGAWFDLDLDACKPRTNFYPSNIFPLLANCTTKNFTEVDVAEKVLNYVKRTGVLNYPGGIPTSLTHSGEQWDFPNAWSPLVHFMVESLAKLQLPEAQRLTNEIIRKWITSNMAAWKKHGHMYEKYDVTVFGSAGGGGEYDVQTGFGWSNGVALMLIDKYSAIIQSLKVQD